MVDLVQTESGLEYTHTINSDDLANYVQNKNAIVIPCNLQHLAMAQSADSVVTYFLPEEVEVVEAEEVVEADEEVIEDEVEAFDSEDDEAEEPEDEDLEDDITLEPAPRVQGPVMGGCTVGFTSDSITLSVPPAKMVHVANGRRILVRFKL